MTEEKHITKEKILGILGRVKDPEIPVLSVIDLGIVRDIIIPGTGKPEVVITPTYSGCPAMDVITAQIRMELMAEGVGEVNVRTVLSPAWTTDWMTEAGKAKLLEYGIAPPLPRQQVCNISLFADETVPCPRCRSIHTKLISRFGSTACKSLYQCLDCQEPFDYFKCH